MTSLVVISVCPNDGVTAGMITLVLMLLLPAPADEEGALVEEVLVGEGEHAWTVFSLGVVVDEQQVLAESKSDSTSTWIVCALRAAGVEPACTCCRFFPLSVGSRTDLTFRQTSSDSPFTTVSLQSDPTECDTAGVPLWGVLVMEINDLRFAFLLPPTPPTPPPLFLSALMRVAQAGVLGSC